MSVDWDNCWNKKATAECDDPIEISGFEKLPSLDTEIAAKMLLELLKIQPGDNVLEVGCGAGLLARHIQSYCNYVGTDRSLAMIKKTIKLNGFSALRCNANDLVFKDKSFDHVFAFGVFHYFPNHDYAAKCISEMKRVSRKSVCISDLPVESHEPSHLLFDEQFFAGWLITDPFYKREHRRFTATLFLS